MLKRIFDIDRERCPCGGKLKFVAVIEQPEVIEKILTHLGLSPQPLPIAPARRACFVCAVSMRDRGKLNQRLSAGLRVRIWTDLADWRFDSGRQKALHLTAYAAAERVEVM